MIDEPLALLAEAFGQEPESLTPQRSANDTADEAAMAFVTAAAAVGQAESATSVARTA